MSCTLWANSILTCLYVSQNKQQLFRKNQQLHTFIRDCVFCAVGNEVLNISYITVLRRFSWRATKLNLTVSVYQPVFLMQKKKNKLERTADSGNVLRNVARSSAR